MITRFCSVFAFVSFGLACFACSSSSAPAGAVDASTSLPGDAGAIDANVIDAGEDASAAPLADASDASFADVDKSLTCAPTFGQALGTVGFARFDGTVVAVVPPGDQACAEPNSTHLVIQIAMSGAVYRMVVDVDDTSATGTVHTGAIAHALVGGAWADGWHTIALDYVNTLGLHSAAVASMSTAQAVAWTTSHLDLGARVSIFATAQGEADSAHLVHRNLTNQDGAIVIDVDGSSPTWLLFSFADQAF